jgi:aminotransferase in exopolysaccharide biosynthesis
MSNHDFTDAFMAMVREVFGTSEFIPLHAPRFEGQEKELILETLESTFVSSVGMCVEQFEEDIARYTGAQFAVAVSSGTAALHTALHAAGVVQHDEVITTPLTFVATCNAISYCGARPVFVDVDRDTLGLSPECLAEFLEQYGEVRGDGHCWNRSSGNIIRACVPVHNLGHPARAGKIVKVCERYNIPVIEDAAESLGSLADQQHTGRVGLMGVLSFNGNKIITTGGGGALITDNAVLAKRLKHLTTTAKTPHPWLFQHDEVGFNYRLPNLNAALGLAQMAQLAAFVAKKRDLAKYYSEWLDEWLQVRFFTEPAEARSNYWLNAILLPDRAARDEFLGRTNDCGIMTRPMWTPMHTLPMYQSCQRSSLDNAELIENTLVNIPSSAVSL